jgi:hypothetical protein
MPPFWVPSVAFGSSAVQVGCAYMAGAGGSPNFGKGPSAKMGRGLLTRRIRRLALDESILALHVEHRVEVLHQCTEQYRLRYFFRRSTVQVRH